MLLVIGSKGVRTFIRALKFLSKYSTELTFDERDNQLQIKTCSTSQISLVIASFDELFFVRFEKSKNPEENKCRLSSKVLLNPLRNPNQIASITLKFDVPQDCIYLNIHKENDFVVRNKINMLEFDDFDDYVLPADHSEVLCQPSVFRRVLQSSKGIDELEFIFKRNYLQVQNFIDYPDEDCEAIRLSYSIDASEFSIYNLSSEKSLVATCDDFVYILNLAQSLNMEIMMQFSVPGRPIVTKLRSDESYTLTLVQATLPPKSISKRNLKNQSYKQIVTSYVEKRLTTNETNKECVRDSSTGRDVQNQVEIDQNDKSSQPTYVSTPSTRIRNNSKRKSDEPEKMNMDDHDKTLDDLSAVKKRKTGATKTTANSSIVLSQKEMNELHDIMANIEDYGRVDVDIEPEQQQPLASQSENIQNQMSENQNTEYQDLLMTHHRWPLHNSYFRNSEDVEKENPVSGKKAAKGVDKLFGHMFKPRSRIDFGKVLVIGSDDEDE